MWTSFWGYVNRFWRICEAILEDMWSDSGGYVKRFWRICGIGMILVATMFVHPTLATLPAGAHTPLGPKCMCLWRGWRDQFFSSSSWTGRGKNHFKIDYVIYKQLYTILHYPKDTVNYLTYGHTIRARPIFFNRLLLTDTDIENTEQILITDY
jgi:hypothetical protein